MTFPLAVRDFVPVVVEVGNKPKPACAVQNHAEQNDQANGMFHNSRKVRHNYLKWNGSFEISDPDGNHLAEFHVSLRKSMITSVAPKLPFIDKQQTVDYYVNRLGFDLRSDYGDYIIVELEGAELHFFPYPELVPGKSDFMIYLRINEGIEMMYQMFQKRGIAIHPNGKLEDKPWGQKEFAVIDPNGTLLTFGQGIS